MRHRVKARGGRRDWAGLLRRWTIPVIGALTPVALIVVNIAAFIVHHLATFRWTITILAFVSGMMLNSWAGLKIYRVLKRRMGGHALVDEGNQDLVLIGGMAVIIAISFVTALFCYWGLENEQNLPNGTTFLTGVLAIAVPILLQAVFNRVLGGSRGHDVDMPVTGLPASMSPPPPPPPPSVPLREPLERRR